MNGIDNTGHRDVIPQQDDGLRGSQVGGVYSLLPSLTSVPGGLRP